MAPAEEIVANHVDNRRSSHSQMSGWLMEKSCTDFGMLPGLNWREGIATDILCPNADALLVSPNVTL